MRMMLPILLLLLAGCASPNARPTQGVLPSCALYAIADAAEIQYGKPISSEERLRVWRGIGHLGMVGLTLDQAFSAAERAGWVPGDSYLRIWTLDSISDGPLIAVLRDHRHAVLVLSVGSGSAIVLDPRYSDTQSMSLAKLETETRGFYYRVAR